MTPDFALVETIVKALNPCGFDEEEVQACLGAIALDRMDE
jgi:hypothetical protein